MIFSEIAIEGVRCFREQCRFVLKQGYNLLWGSNESGKSTLAQCIAVLLDPARELPEDCDYPSRGPGGNSRAGLVIAEGNNKFRLTRDFVNGQVSLFRLNPETGKFDVVTQKGHEVASFLEQQLKMPPVQTWKKIFYIDREDMPSGRPKVITRKVAAPNPATSDAGAPQAMQGMGGPAAAAPQPAAQPGYGMSPEEIKKRLEDLEKQKERADRIQKVQYEIDELESRLFEIENQTKEITSMEDKYRQLDESVKALESFKDLPPDIVKRIEFFEEVQKEHDSRLAEVDRRMDKVKADFDRVKNREVFYKTRNFLIGIGLIIAGIIVQAAVAPKMSAIKILPPLMIIAGIGLAFWVLWNELSSRTKEGELSKQVKSIEEERNEEVRKFDVEGSVVRRLMSEAGVEDPKELNKKLKEYQKRQESMKELDQKIRKTKIESDYDQLTEQKKEIQGKIEELNKELQDAGETGITQDPDDLQRQIDSLKYTLENPDAPPPPQAGGASPGTPGMPGQDMAAGMGAGSDYMGPGADDALGGGEFDFAAGGAPGVENNPDRTMISSGETATSADEPSRSGIEGMVEELWSAAEAVSGADRSTLIMQISERFNLYLQAFTGNRYNEGDLSSETSMSLRNSMGSYTELVELSPSTQDAAWLALKIALIENLYQKVRLPMVLDDPLRNLDDSRLATVSKALKRMGSACQVLLFSTHRAHSKVADHVINLESG